MHNLINKLEMNLDRKVMTPKNILETQLAQELPHLLELSIQTLESVLKLGGIETKLIAATLILRSAITLAKIKP